MVRDSSRAGSRVERQLRRAQKANVLPPDRFPQALHFCATYDVARYSQTDAATADCVSRTMTTIARPESAAIGKNLRVTSDILDIRITPLDVTMIPTLTSKPGFGSASLQRVEQEFPAATYPVRAIGRWLSTASDMRSVPKSVAFSMSRMPIRRWRARLTRLLMVPTAHPEMAATSS